MDEAPILELCIETSKVQFGAIRKTIIIERSGNFALIFELHELV